MKKVIILYKSMPQYRVEFFNLLGVELNKHGIEMKLIYGSIDSKGKNDSRDLDSGTFRPNKFIKVGKTQLIWQPAMREVKEADLVIVEQASKLLINYLLLFRRLIGGAKFAFWGHGLNMQDYEGSLLNRFKRLYSNYTDHWFAYTPKVKERLIASGYPSQNITVVSNAIDTQSLVKTYQKISDKETTDLRSSLGVMPGETVFIYCGALYKEKRLDFLISVGDSLARDGYKFKLLIVGGGPQEDEVKKAAETRDWLICTGPKFGKDKVGYFKIADLFLMPGAIGLAILDAFALETPMITTSYEFHGPEFEYLKDEMNGMITDNNLTDYISCIKKLLDAPSQVERLKDGCRESRSLYTVEQMVQNFAEGVVKALS
ncbi:group 1 glycosyl transferase [Pedobacter yulinensis]|uniref:Group 1 glycosyl transferase n=1 Tax=Pedobacter yulinensis TaxID=2126353 RepID=A0A2T3HQT6_9SPHI|nr:glycosyltransferase family 4 protein [Pedobacter yulinensis]PST84761.1 group 1 glycosyl transferase [Pedobacter yulinensis]